MKELLLLLSLFCFATFQVQASSCLLHCEFKKAVENQKQTSAKSSGHDCCHGKKGKSNKEEKEDSESCMGSFDGTCFHGENQNTSVVFLNSIQDVMSSKDLMVLETPVMERFVLSYFQNSIPLKIPPHSDRKFLRYKAQISLFLLKDQFLI